MLLHLALVCICGGLREMSRFSELLKNQDLLVQLLAQEGAGCFQRAGCGSVLFTYKNRQHRSFLSPWTIGIRWGMSSSGAATPARSAPWLGLLGWVGLSSAQGPGQAHLCLREVILEKLVFIGGLNSLTWVWQVAIKYVTGSFVTLIGVRCFLAVWKYEGTWCCQAPWIESSKLWNREACNMYSGTKEFSCSWKLI